MSGSVSMMKPVPLHTLENQPQDVLLLLSATLFNPLQPEHAPLYSTCKAVRHALAGAVAVLRAECGALRATLAKTGSSACDIAAGATDLCWCVSSITTAMPTPQFILVRAAQVWQDHR